MKQADAIRAAATRKRAKERANAEAQATVISQQRLLFQVRAGENNRLYGSVTSADLAEKLEALVGFEVDRRRVLLDAAIRELGVFPITIRLMQDVDATFR
ncbi:MAG: 50S ribosomal protein L9 [Caldilineaceae bacterium]